jgi:hypothetical protein
MVFLIRVIALAGLLVINGPFAVAQNSQTDTRPGIAPDIRNDETELKLQRGNFVAVPIPISDPTLGTGLVVGAAYFYAQSKEEKKSQPASLTAAGGLYTDNDSKAFVIAQQNYWNHDRWRFTGALGGADLRISLLAPTDSQAGESLDWRIKGNFLFAKLAGRLVGDWYGGLFTRMIDANQTIEGDVLPSNLDTRSDLLSIGLGAFFEYDSRDTPLASHNGRHFKIDALFNDETIGSDATYQSYSAAYRSYHEISDSVVLAWEIQGCERVGAAPLWDACTIKLRGFAATDFLGRTSASSQLEARWQLTRRWGLVAFGGAGYVGSSFSKVRENEAIPSYGVGVRFMVLPAKRVSLRIDFARSVDSDAIHVSVGEAF